MSAEKLLDQLRQSGVIGARGETYFELNGLKTLVLDTSIVGNVIQEWLKCFMDAHGITYRIKNNTQEFPDFLVDANSEQSGLLEVKCFKKSPNFDVPYRLNADYLIVEYGELEQGIVIKNIWLKKVWEICSASERSPLKIQWKQGVPFNIRPATWFAKKPMYPAFSSRYEFVQALKKVLDTSAISGSLQKGWFDKVSKKYKEQTGMDL
jgi:NgoBV restriction endonuclease